MQVIYSFRTELVGKSSSSARACVVGFTVTKYYLEAGMYAFNMCLARCCMSFSLLLSALRGIVTTDLLRGNWRLGLGSFGTADTIVLVSVLSLKPAPAGKNHFR